MQVDVVRIPSSLPSMAAGPFEESWNRVADILFADAAQSGLEALTVFIPMTWSDSDWLTLRSAYLPDTHSGLSGAVWISNDSITDLTGFSRIYWVHQEIPRGENINLGSRVESYAVWTRSSRWWGAGVRLADLMHATALRDRCMSRSQAQFVRQGDLLSQFHLDIYDGQEVPHAHSLAAGSR